MREGGGDGQGGVTHLDGFQPIEDVLISIRAELDRKTISFRDLLALDEGSVVCFPRPAGENVDVYAEDVLIATGEIILVESTLGVRLADLREVRTAPNLQVGIGAAT